MTKKFQSQEVTNIVGSTNTVTETKARVSYARVEMNIYYTKMEVKYILFANATVVGRVKEDLQKLMN